MVDSLRKRNDSEIVIKREQRAREEIERDKGELPKKLDGINAVEKAGYFSRLFFSWAKPLLKHAKKYQVNIDELGVVREEDDVRVQKTHLEQKWNEYKDSSKDNKLYWAVLSAYKWEFTVAIFWNIIIASLQISIPFILRYLIVFIQD